MYEPRFDINHDELVFIDLTKINFTARVVSYINYLQSEM